MADWDHIALARRISELERQQDLVREAAERVVWFDWSGNDSDAVEAIEQLRRALEPTTAQKAGDQT